MTAQPWWRDRVIGAFASYFVYQHLGNLAPDELGGQFRLPGAPGSGSDAERERILSDSPWPRTRARCLQWAPRDFGRARGMLDVGLAIWIRPTAG